MQPRKVIPGHVRPLCHSTATESHISTTTQLRCSVDFYALIFLVTSLCCILPRGLSRWYCDYLQKHPCSPAWQHLIRGQPQSNAPAKYLPYTAPTFTTAPNLAPNDLSHAIVPQHPLQGANHRPPPPAGALHPRALRDAAVLLLEASRRACAAVRDPRRTPIPPSLSALVGRPNTLNRIKTTCVCQTQHRN